MQQRSFDDLGTPLAEVTFCVVDLETTGGSVESCGITEVGAVKLRGGECLGTFQTLVNPGSAIPPEITVLTGITEAMVLPAPRIEAVLPALLEFAGDAVLVGHNLRFDLAFLDAALERSGRPRLRNRTIDTLALARRLVRDEVPNLKLATLASRLRLDHPPSHRALDDALATADLLHLLLERAAGLGVTGLDDLLALPTMAGHAQAAKLKLTARLPRSPGVYLFRDRAGRVLYVGKATNLRARVRSYFSTETRRKVGSLLRETAHIDHVACRHPLEAAVREVRLIHELRPPYNRHARDWERYVYLKLTDETFPRLSVVRTLRPDDGFYLGPLPSTRFARRVAEAIETAVPLRRCTGRPGSVPRPAPCAPAQLGVATCPCAGTTSAAEYAAIVERARRGLTCEPELLLEPLRKRMAALAAAERYEEAADVRDRSEALAQALRRQRRMELLRAAGRLVVELPGQGGAELSGGRLVRSWGCSEDPHEPVPAFDPATAPPDGLPEAAVPRELADELLCVARWLEQEAGRLRLVHAERGLASPLPALPSFAPRRAAPAR
ncbi:DEDD exonuclease domain-containing protein [Rhabdothermincola sp.]|uniref:DEDD exonuclease domain-containing protein n=1 Tax=Rhabdothermincola sp. TaxID=2820405 RepID=UPI002FE2533D